MSSVPEPGGSSAGEDLRRLEDVWLAFAVTWSAAVLFHLAGNPTLAPQWGRAFLGVTAVALLMRPRVVWLAVPLSLAVVTNVWLEAPLLGNHWLLHGLIALVVLGAVLTTGGRPAEAMSRIGGPARLTLLAFYGFAAFAKVNTDFFDPAVSCATFYLRESADSWGALGLVDGWPGWADRVVAFVVAGPSSPSRSSSWSAGRGTSASWWPWCSTMSSHSTARTSSSISRRSCSPLPGVPRTGDGWSVARRCPGDSHATRAPVGLGS